MRNIKLKIAYDGTDFSGWQIQPNSVTIEGILKSALEKILRHEVKLYAAGRTDAGVHAKAQIANFFTDQNIPAENIPKALRKFLPETIVIYEAIEMPKDFHARFSAKNKTYRYTIDNANFYDVFNLRFAHHERRTLKLQTMQATAKLFKGKHDFTSFCAAHGSSKTFERTIKQFEIYQKQDFFTIEINADGFLYHMVRNLTGLLLEVGAGKLTPEDAFAILEAKDRKLAPATAPAKGLCLWEVFY